MKDGITYEMLERWFIATMLTWLIFGVAGAKLSGFYEAREGSVEDVAVDITETVAAVALEAPAASTGLTERIDESVLPVEEVEAEEIIEVEALAVAEPEYAKLYTDEDAIALAKMVWGEARGIGELVVDGRVISGDCQKAATIWSVLNRYDAGFGDTILEVVSAPYQYLGYRETFPVDEELLALSYDVLDRWTAEKYGETDVGRVLPPEYMWFYGDGKHNHFRDEYRGKDTWKWCYEDPYGE